MGTADREAHGLIDLGVQPGHLVERDTQRLLGQVLVLDVDRRAEDAHAALLQLGQVVGREHAGALALVVQIHQHVEVHVDHAVRVQSVDPRLNGGVRC